jgi:hypothetical protein
MGASSLSGYDNLYTTTLSGTAQGRVVGMQEGNKGKKCDNIFISSRVQQQH